MRVRVTERVIEGQTLRYVYVLKGKKKLKD